MGSSRTNLADLTVPAWLYVVSRRLHARGLFAGTLDPLDNGAYALGLAICYTVERRYGGPRSSFVERLTDYDGVPCDEPSTVILCCMRRQQVPAT